MEFKDNKSSGSWLSGMPCHNPQTDDTSITIEVKMYPPDVIHKDYKNIRERIYKSTCLRAERLLVT